MRRFVGALVLALLLATSAAPVSASVGTVSLWQAKIGSGGANGIVSITTNASGTGSLTISAKRLRGNYLYSLGLYRGSCTALGTRFISLTSQRSNGSGVISKTLSLTRSQVTALWNAGGTRVIRFGTGSNARCGGLSILPVKGTQAIGSTVLIPPRPGGAFHLQTVLDFVRFNATNAGSLPAAGNALVSVLIDLDSYDLVVAQPYGDEYYALRDSTGFEYDASPLVGYTPLLGSGDLLPGGSVRGWVTFEVARAALAGGFSLVYRPARASALVVRLGVAAPAP